MNVNHDALVPGAAQHKSAKSRRAQQERVRARHAGNVERCRVPVGLGEPYDGRGEHDRAERAEQDENGAPVEPLGEVGAESRRDRRRQRHCHHDERQAARRHLPVIDVADDRPAQDDAGASAERLQQPPDDQGRERPCAGAQHRPSEKQSESGDQDRPAAEAVRHRPIDQLPRGDAPEIQAQHELHVRRAVAEHLDEDRQCRHDHVQGAERQGRNRRQQRQ